MCLASILSVGCGSISEENKSNERVENIENHIPYIDKNNDEIDNSIINERYENVKKEDLTYDTEKDDSKDNEKEVITEVYSADSIKNDINYKKILQGFSYASESNPCDLTYNQAIELVKKLLPDDIKQVNSTVDEEVDKEYIYYESSKGNFRVGLSYGYEFNDENIDVVNNQEKLNEFERRMKACRILVNTPSAQGGIGDIYNFKLSPSLTLGCGSWGNNSFSGQVGPLQLINIKTVAERRENMLWFRTPAKTFIKKGCLGVAIKELGTEYYDFKKAFIVTDSFLYQNGYTKPITDQLDAMGIQHSTFYEVEPDPTLACAKKGAEQMRLFNPDVVIAVGGGSAMDAAKIMWVMYEHPECNFLDLAMRFMDIRKRVYQFPQMGKKAKFVAIPTSSGTGSEVTPFAVITDEKTGQKYPLADYELMPTIAIVDADMMMHQPKGLTSASGIDALTHALEAYAAMLQTEFTDGLALQATKSIFEYLPRAYENGAKDPIAREKMAHASTMAGMAFANAFLGVCHSLAHKLGAYHHIPHGVANALLINKVLEFNVNSAPRKMGTFPQYAYPNMLARYAEVATFVGCTGTDEEKFEQLQQKINELKTAVGIPNTIREFGVDEQAFLDTLDEMVEAAFDDQCTGANPRYPLFSEIREMYLRAYYGDAEYDRMNAVEVKEEKVEDVKEGEHHPHLKEKIKAKAEKVKAGVR